MGYKYKWATTTEVDEIATDIAAIAKKIAAIADKMEESKLDPAILPISDALGDTIQRLTEFPGICDAMIDVQLQARKDGKKSKYEKAMDKSKKDAATRKNRVSKKTSKS